jgi:replicative DNA helicase
VNNEEISTENLCEIIIAKNRNGMCKTVPLMFFGSMMKFTEYSQGENQEEASDQLPF